MQEDLKKNINDQEEENLNNDGRMFLKIPAEMQQIKNIPPRE